MTQLDHDRDIVSWSTMRSRQRTFDCRGARRRSRCASSRRRSCSRMRRPSAGRASVATCEGAFIDSVALDAARAESVEPDYLRMAIFGTACCAARDSWRASGSTVVQPQHRSELRSARVPRSTAVDSQRDVRRRIAAVETAESARTERRSPSSTRSSPRSSTAPFGGSCSHARRVHRRLVRDVARDLATADRPLRDVARGHLLRAVPRRWLRR